MPSNAIARILPDSPARAAQVRAELDGITGTAHAHPREAVALAGLARAMDDIPDTGDMDATLRGMVLVDGGPQRVVTVHEVPERFDEFTGAFAE